MPPRAAVLRRRRAAAEPARCLARQAVWLRMCSTTVGRCWLPLRLLLALLLLAASAAGIQRQFQRTFRSNITRLHHIDGSHIPRGYITSEGFGEPPWLRRAAPHSATWLLAAPPQHAVFVYMTQYHLADGDLRFSSFNVCLNRSRGVALCSWDWLPDGQDGAAGVEARRRDNANAVRHTTEYVATKRGDSWLVLELELPAGGGGGPADGCLQATESRGFNITYEVVKLGPAGSRVKELARRDWCHVERCSFNGDCLASADFR